jgi:pimeloyl-ACP methyl ester carboxylesterase
MDPRTSTITVGAGAEARDIAVLHRQGSGKDKATIVWLGGYRSDMSGTKALALDELAASLNTSCIRFDYSGHGASGGAFRDGTITRWLEEALAVLDVLKPRRVVLVGSSMGGWIALRLMQELKKTTSAPKLDGIVLIAPAPDFTSELIEPNLTVEQRQSLQDQGYFEETSEYSPEANIYTRKLIEDGRANSVLTGIIETGCPVHILQGMQDPDVPYQHALKLVEFLPADDVVLTLIRDGDHRLSRPQDIEKMAAAVRGLILHDQILG